MTGGKCCMTGSTFLHLIHRSLKLTTWLDYVLLVCGNILFSGSNPHYLTKFKSFRKDIKEQRLSS